jgi:hypothetical protein
MKKINCAGCGDWEYCYTVQWKIWGDISGCWYPQGAILVKEEILI